MSYKIELFFLQFGLFPHLHLYLFIFIKTKQSMCNLFGAHI